LSNTPDEGVMEDLADLFVFDSLRRKRPHGSADDPYLLGLRVEHLLSVTNTQRANQIARLAARGDARAIAPHGLVLGSEDMAEIMNAWRAELQTWMNPQSLEELAKKTRQQDIHKACHSKFNTMLFQLIGNKALVDLFVRYPMCSAEQPAAILRSFAEGWHRATTSPEAERAREISEPRSGRTEPRLSKQIYELKDRLKRGKWIADWIRSDWSNWDQLGEADQRLWTEYTNGGIQHQLTELREQRQPKFPGVAECLHGA